MDANAKLKRSDNVTFQVVADEAILIRLDTGTTFSLNKVGTEFWQMLDGRRTIEEHASALADKNNRIVQSATEGLTALATRIAGDFGTQAQALIEDLRQYAQSVASKYLVGTPLVVGDLLELAEKMAADKLVESVA